MGVTTRDIIFALDIPMHVILASRWYPPRSGHGGVAMYNYYMAHALVKLGHRVTVIAARHSEVEPPYEMDGNIAIHRLYHPYRYRLHRLPLLGRYMRAIEQFNYSRQVAEKLNELDSVGQIDVVEFADVNAEGFVYLRQSERKPVVVRCHTPTFVLKRYAPPGAMTYDTRLITWMEKAAIHAADALTAPSTDMARVIEQDCNLRPGSVTVIPNALDVDRFQTKERKVKKQDSEWVTVLHVGRMDPVKGIDVLAEAIPQIIDQVPNVRFVFIGKEGEYGDRLRRLFQEKGIAQHVEMLGLVEEEILLEWYYRADISVVPTLNYESFSYTCAQPMAAGLPVVASRIGGIPETLNDGGCGILVSPSDAEELALAVEKLARDVQLRHQLALAGYERARSKFDASIVAREMVNLYQEVLSYQ